MTRAQNKRASLPLVKLEYPGAYRGSETDDCWGTKVPDPYRQLEVADSEETRAWLDAQSSLTESFLAEIPARAAIRQRLLTLWNYPWRSAPIRQGNRRFFWANTGLQNHDVLYVVDSNGSQERVLLDPNTLSEEGTTAFVGMSISQDGNLLAYGISHSGSDWTEWYVKEIASGQDRPDHLRWVKFSSASWAKDGGGFYYSRFDEPKDVNAASSFHKLFFHRLGTPQSQDVLVYERPDEKDWRFFGQVTQDGQYLIIVVAPSVAGKNRIYFKDLKTGNLVKLLDEEAARWHFIDNEGPTFWFLTNLHAPRWRVVAINVNNSTETRLDMKEVIPETKDLRVSLPDVYAVGNRFFAIYKRDAHTEIQEVSLEGCLIRTLSLPGLGNVRVTDAKRQDAELYYTYSSYTTPPTTYCYDIATACSTTYFKPSLDVDPSKYTSRLGFVESKDGTKIPLFITYRKGLKRNGKNPTLLTGYGGFGDSIGPRFSCNHLTWMDLGGVLAEAGIRGGGEYGDNWHEAGTKLRKQNGFDDFIACAEWLTDKANKYTCARKLAISGKSNGGLLVCACMAQRPELFGAVIADVPVTDMIRYHLFTAGSGWKEEYGCVEDSMGQFQALLAYSPYHNLRPGTCYPPALVIAAGNDDRVVPAHPLKFLAMLQHAQGGLSPCLLRMEKEAGHGLGTPLAKQIDQQADELAFLVRVLDISPLRLKRLRQ
jgi:prolyl oligopeptidase